MDNFSNKSFGKKRKFRDEEPHPLNPKGRKPWRTILTSIFLTVVGFVFMYTGFARYPTHTTWDVLPFFAMGVLLLIPGLYHTFIIFKIAIGSEGYTYDMLPNLSEN